MAGSAVFDGLSAGIQEKIGGGDKVVSFQTLAQGSICFVQKFPGTGFELNQAVEYAFHLRHVEGRRGTLSGNIPYDDGKNALIKVFGFIIITSDLISSH